jgi:hypothetical protein
MEIYKKVIMKVTFRHSVGYGDKHKAIKKIANFSSATFDTCEIWSAAEFYIHIYVIIM